MDNADEITNLLAQIAREEAGLSQLSMVKETLQNEVLAKKGNYKLHRVWIENNRWNTHRQTKHKKGM